MSPLVWLGAVALYFLEKIKMKPDKKKKSGKKKKSKHIKRKNLYIPDISKITNDDEYFEDLEQTERDLKKLLDNKDKYKGLYFQYRSSW